MKPYEKHVFVCLGDNCKGRGSSEGYYETISQALKDRHVPAGTVKVTRTQCLGACGFGPNIAVYPEGVWYYGVQPKDVQEIVDEHVLGGRVVTRLLFHKYGETLPDEVVKDAVCGMVFRVSEAQSELKYQGQLHYFCGEHCRVAFQKAPADFLSTSHSHHAHHG